MPFYRSFRKRRIGAPKFFRRIKKFSRRASPWNDSTWHRAGNRPLKSAFTGGYIPARSLVNYASGFAKPACERTFTFCKFGLTVSVAVGGTFNTEELFSLTNPAHPSNAVGGHAVYNWDEMRTFYKQYKVLAVTYKVQVIGSDSNNNVVMCAVQTTGDSFTYSGTTPQYAAEKPGVKLIHGTATIGGPEAQGCCEQPWISIGDIMGYTKKQFDADIVDSVGTTTSTSNPVMNPTLAVAVGNISGSNTGTVTFNVEIKYRVRLWDRITASYST